MAKWPDNLTAGELRRALDEYPDAATVRIYSGNADDDRWGVLSWYGDEIGSDAKNPLFILDIERVRTPRHALARRNVKARKGGPRPGRKVR